MGKKAPSCDTATFHLSGPSKKIMLPHIIQAEDLDASTRKIIHITKDMKPVAGNPFMGKAKARLEIYAYGFRNPDRLAINSVTGGLWEVEFGPRGSDEVNLIKSGGNYGSH
jgi:glucose/arabinose dehydrogenase